MLNTDATIYGGSGVENPRVVRSAPIQSQGRDHSIEVTLPPLGAVYFRYRG